MKLPFRQGIVKYTEDNNKTAIFLDADTRDNYVNLQVSKYSDRVLITFAFHNSNFLFEETKSVYHAWGPFSSNVRYWLYWDINKLTGYRTFGSTIHEPIVSRDTPILPKEDQHWFDLNETCMKVYNGTAWVQNIRVFASEYINGIITPYPLLSQVSIFTECEAGFIVYDDLNTPTSRATPNGAYNFLTSDTIFAGSKSVTTTVSLNQSITHGIASEDLPKHSLVSYEPDGTLKLASYDDEYKSIVVGVTTHDVAAGESFYYKSTSYITSSDIYWRAEPSSPLYLGLHGKFIPYPPVHGFIQKVGHVLSPDTVYIDTSFHNIHYEPNPKLPVPISVNLKTGKFYTPTQHIGCSSYLYYNVQSTNYVFATASYTWWLNHDPRSTNFVVQTFNSIGEMITPKSIVPVSNSTIRITFNTPISGTATLFIY